MQDVKMQDMKMTDQVAGHENAEHKYVRLTICIAAYYNRILIETLRYNANDIANAKQSSLLQFVIFNVAIYGGRFEADHCN